MSIKPLEVTTSKIATKAVTSEKIADKAIETRHIKEGAVTPEKLTITPVSRPINPPVDSAEIKDGAVKTDEIAGNAVTADKIAPNSITAEKILDGAVTREKIRDGAVTKEKMADGTIGTAEIIDGAVTTAKLATSSVTAAKIAAGAVKTSEIADGAVTPEKLSFVPGGAVNKYVPRAVATWDKTRMNFEFDGALHEDGMDLSGIVPTGAIATHLIIEVSGPQGESFQIYANQGTKNCNSFIGFIQGMGGGMGRVHCVIYNDPDRLFDYLLTPGIGDVVVAVAGWFI